MALFIIVLIAILIVIVVSVIKNRLKQNRDYKALRIEVHKTFDKYSFLVDKDLNVKETNFYELNENIKDDQPYVLGNVLHCQTGCDSGLCGTGIACSTCPVRMVLRNGFRDHRDFSDIHATMHLYDAYHQPKTFDVKVDGRFTYIGHHPHFLVKVSKQR